MANKLELTWYGKENRIEVEPRLLLENKELSNCALDENTENMLIHGDNLLALKALEKAGYVGKIKCIYIDPPYNTGAAFEHYDDNLEHSIWLGLMRKRLILLRELLCEKGTIWIQIDDEEQAYLKVLCDEVFGRKNFVNMISVNMKNIAGASGGGEDKRLKKNCEYILIYARNYSLLPIFNGPYVYTEMSELIQKYINDGKSWKYTSVLINPGEKEYIGSTVDGAGSEIKIFRRVGIETMSINQIAKKEGISTKEAYKKYGINVFRTTNAQTSIRTRIAEYRKKNNIHDQYLSIEYVPRTGKNRGTVYEQFYKDDGCNLLVWLKDTSEIIDGELYKKDLQGTYWDMNAWMKNLTKEGSVEFSNGKKPEQLIRQILEMTTSSNDWILDSFLGSGTTAAVATKMGRKWIGVELGNHAYTHCKVRLDRIINGKDAGGITKSVNWQGGGGYRFYELAPSLILEDAFGEMVINKEYNADMLAAAVALHEGFVYAPDKEKFWKQAKANENSYLLTTTRCVTKEFLDSIRSTMDEGEFLIIACKSFISGVDKLYSNISVKKIPQMLLNNCEFGKEDYNLNIVHPPVYDDCEVEEDE